MLPDRCSNRQSSLKADTRNSRGTIFTVYIRHIITKKDFTSNFLCNAKNNESLNTYLADAIVKHDFGEKNVVITVNDYVYCNNSAMDETLANLRMTFRQEETDTKIIVHLSDCIRSGHDNVIVNTAYTDVVTLVLAYQPYFKRPCHIIIDFNFGSNRRSYDINKIVCSIPTDVLLGLMFFYVFTGSDVTSSFYQLSKVTWWNL